MDSGPNHHCITEICFGMEAYFGETSYFVLVMIIVVWKTWWIHHWNCMDSKQITSRRERLVRSWQLSHCQQNRQWKGRKLTKLFIVVLGCNYPEDIRRMLAETSVRTKQDMETAPIIFQLWKCGFEGMLWL